MSAVDTPEIPANLLPRQWHCIQFNGQQLKEIGLLDDNTLWNPNGYSPDLVIAALVDVQRRNQEAIDQSRIRKAEQRRKLKERGPKPLRFRYVYHTAPDGKLTKLSDIGIYPDGTLINPNGYPDEEVRAALQRVHGDDKARRQKAAQKAAQTRAKRDELEVYRIAKLLISGKKVGPAQTCVKCGKGLTDAPSIERGIGSECWQTIILAIETQQAQTAAVRV